MAALLAQGGNWDIRGLFHTIGWRWIVGFVIVFASSGVLAYFKLRRPPDKSVATRKSG